MEEQFTPITDTDALDALFASSASEPVILFKHDPYCPISAAAYRQMTKLPEQVAVIDVAHDSELSHEAAARTGVRHESPQVIVLKDGEVVWSASHSRIKADAVERIVEQETPAAR
jgi:bacillithiol system protein YtxJ